MDNNNSIKSGMVGWTSRLLAMVAALVVVFLYSCEARAQVRSWNLDANGNWSVNTNWTPNWVSSGYTSNTYPNALSTIVKLESAITATRTLTLDVGATMGVLKINSANNYVISGSSTLTFDNGAEPTAVLTVMGGGSPTISAPIALVDPLRIDQQSAGTLTLSGVMSGGQAVNKRGTGTVDMTASNTISSTVSVDAGTLKLSGANGSATSVTGWTLNSYNGAGTLTLDNSGTGNANRVGNTATVTMYGGAVSELINTASGSYGETLGALTINSGGASITTQRAASGQTNALTFASFARGAGGTVNFSGDSLGQDTRNRILFTTAPTLTNGIIGGFATVDANWATYGANGITALTTYNTGAQTAWLATLNAAPTADQTLTAARNLYTLNLTNGIDVALGGFTFDIYSGGILKSGGTASIISGTGTLTAGGAAGTAGNLTTHVLSGSSLTINSVIGNNGAGVVGLIKAGDGTLTLGGVNTYTGATVLNGGTTVASVRQALGTGALTLNDGSELQAGWNDSVNYGSPGSITINNGTITRTAASANPTRYLSNAGGTTLTVNGMATLKDTGNTSGGYLGFDGPVVVNSGGTLLLNAVNANDSVRLGGSQSITINAGGTIQTTGSGTNQISNSSARAITATGTTTDEAKLVLNDTTTFNSSSTVTINGSGSGGLRVEGTQTGVNNFLTSGRVSGLTGSGGTLTLAMSNENTTNNFSYAPSAGSNLKLGFDIPGSATNMVYTLGTAANDLANWNGLVVKGGRVELAVSESLTGAGTTTLQVDGGLLSLAGGTPVGGKTLTIEGDATLNGGVIDGGPGGGSRGKLILGGNIISQGTTLSHSPDIQMQPTSGTVTIDGSAPLYGIGTLTKTGAGTVQVNEEISANTIDIKAGTLLLGNDNRINDTVNVTLSGGTLNTGGFDETLGLLSLTGGSTIDLGAGGSLLKFSDSHFLSWTGTLSITNWTDGTDQIYVGTSATGLTGSQLTRITFSNPYGDGLDLTADIDSSGQLKPHRVPEPATLVTMILLVGAIGRREWPRIRRRFASNAAK